MERLAASLTLMLSEIIMGFRGRILCPLHLSVYLPRSEFDVVAKAYWMDGGQQGEPAEIVYLRIGKCVVAIIPKGVGDVPA